MKTTRVQFLNYFSYFSCGHLFAIWIALMTVWCPLAQKALKHRRVKHYGYEFRYDNNNVDKDKPLTAGRML